MILKHLYLVVLVIRTPLGFKKYEWMIVHFADINECIYFEITSGPTSRKKYLIDSPLKPIICENLAIIQSYSSSV